MPLHYLSSCFVVVQVHQSAGVFFNLSSIHKPPGELDAMFDVSGAASPLPALFLVVVALFISITATMAHVTLATCCCHRMGHSGSCDGVGECSLLAAWGKRD